MESCFLKQYLDIVIFLFIKFRKVCLFSNTSEIMLEVMENRIMDFN